MQNQTVSELKDFVKKLNSLPEMTVTHTLSLFSMESANVVSMQAGI